MSTRRSFIKGVGGAAALGLLGSSSDSRADWVLFGGKRYNILEIYVRGGISHRDTLFPTASSGAFCATPNPDLWVSEPCRWGDGVSDSWALVDWVNHPKAPGHAPWNVPAARLPTNGLAVNLRSANGAILARCSGALDGLAKGGDPSRPSLLPQTRLLAMRHAEPELMPHEAAAPYALTGSRLGRGNMAGMAAAVAAARSNQLSTPASFVPAPVGTSLVFGGDITGGYLDWASATGLFGDAFRPPVIQFPDPHFRARLAATAGRTTERGSLDDFYTNQMAKQLTHPQLGGARSSAFASYRSTFTQLGSAQALINALAAAPNYDAPLPVYTAFPSAPKGPDRVARMINTAALLLKGGNTRYVCILDGSVVSDFDTHGTGSATPWREHASLHNFNLWWLLAQIQANFTPTDLLDTLIVVHSEFGRRVTSEISSHNPRGYGALVIGGPVAAAGVTGSIDTQNHAVDAISPLDLRAAMYLAAQIEPYQGLTNIGVPKTFAPEDHLVHDPGYNIGRLGNGLNALGLTSLQLAGGDTTSGLEYSLRQGLAQAVFGRI